MTSKASPDGADGEGERPFGRARVVHDPNSPPGPVFRRPPPADPVLLRLHSLWIDATDETVGSVLDEARETAGEVGPELAEWVNAYVAALERLERWLRDR